MMSSIVVGNKPRYVSAQPSQFMKDLAMEDIMNRKKRLENDNEYAILDEEETDEE